MKHLFTDTNVLLDFIGRREPFAADATRLLEAAAGGYFTLHVSALSFSHIDYALRKILTPAVRLTSLTQLAQTVEIIPIGRPVIEAALTLGFTDFEDALQYAAARAVPAIAAIVTRDPKGFATGTLPVYSPAEALRLL